MLIEFIKKCYRHTFVWPVRKSDFFRKLATKNYSTGKLAIGELRLYTFPKDWVRVDMCDSDFNINLNGDFTFPFADNSYKMIYSGHCFEHMDEERVIPLLKESFRILEKGGKVRIEIPDAEKSIQLYKNGDKRLGEMFHPRHQLLVDEYGYDPIILEEHMPLVSILSNYIPLEHGKQVPPYIDKETFDKKLETMDLDSFCKWSISLQTEEQLKTAGHKSFYYFDKIKRMMEESGFKDVKKMAFGQSEIPGISLNKGSQKKGLYEKPHREFFSLYVEATK